MQHKHANHDQNNTNDEKTKTKKWIIFTYCSPLIRKAPIDLNAQNVGISFKNTNITQKLTKPKIRIPTLHKNSPNQK
jgi:hypothetical protein